LFPIIHYSVMTLYTILLHYNLCAHHSTMISFLDLSKKITLPPWYTWLHSTGTHSADDSFHTSKPKTPVVCLPMASIVTEDSSTIFEVPLNVSDLSFGLLVLQRLMFRLPPLHVPHSTWDERNFYFHPWMKVTLIVLWSGWWIKLFEVPTKFPNSYNNGKWCNLQLLPKDKC
jgi:hypothetical protein